jgi:hypothetical protein
MTNDARLRLLRPALVLVAIVMLCLYPLTLVWPSGWSWSPGTPPYLQMIIGIYATLGVFLLLASRNPAEHRSLIWFAVWSSVVHAGVMAVHAYTDAGQMGHLWGDVAALVLVAVVLGVLAPPRPA